MAITKINIADFTVFKNFCLEPSPGINVLIGENGTGKTHLLKLMYAAALARDEKMDKFVNVFEVIGNTSFKIKNIVDGVVRTDQPFDAAVLNREITHAESSREPPRNYLGKESPIHRNYEIIVESDNAYDPLFIPAKEMPSLAKFTNVANQFKKAMSPDPTLFEIVERGRNENPDDLTPLAEKIIPRLEEIIDGTVFINPIDQTFWVRKHNGAEIPFSMESEGIRKFALFWKLIMNHNLKSGDVLLWDEPEANISLKLIPDLVKIIFELVRNNVQVFIATHDYSLAKYLEIRCEEGDILKYHSLAKEQNGVAVETCDNFRELKQNVIMSSLDILMDEIVTGNMGD